MTAYRSFAVLGTAAAVALLLGGCGTPRDVASPAIDRAFDALSGEEIEQAVTGARTQAQVSATARIVSVWLEEPSKDSVLAGRLGGRRARVVTYDAAREETVESIVDLGSARAVRSRVVRDVQPMLGMTDSRLADEIVRADPRWAAAMFRTWRRGRPGLASDS